MNLPGLQIRSPLVSPKAANFRPHAWPPPDDFPVVIDSKGRVVSRYSDSRWDFTPWAGTMCSINFGDGQTNGARISPRNAALFRQVTAWLLWGADAVQNPRTLSIKHGLLKHLFAACSEAGILATDLGKYPKVVENLAERLPESSAFSAFALFHDLWAAREPLGFVLLDQAALGTLGGLIPLRDSTQTAYIPPRIWTYQVVRLRECLDDFHTHRDAVESCFQFCLEAYATNAGGDLSRTFAGMRQSRAPFHPENERKIIDGCKFYGAFRHTTQRFGIYELLGRWVNASDVNGIKAFSNYLTLISHVGLAYVLNFSLMRIDEASQLRADCHQVERDLVGDDIHLLRGKTTKTVPDDSAIWITSPSVKVAIDAMTSVARLRAPLAQLDPSLEVEPDYAKNPLLQVRAHEPWAPSKVQSCRKRPCAYGEIIGSWPKLFDAQALRVTEDDLSLARRMTLGLDPDRFAVGKAWPFAWHQLRRTGAVNMLASGLVSDASLQYQLKHATRAMSRYYGQNYYLLSGHIDDEARGLYLREMYDAVVREFESLADARFISPLGDRRKDQIVSPILEKDHNGLLRDAKSGRVSYRQTFLGGCAKPGPPCELGGISNISGCTGYDGNKPCEWALIDRAKRPLIENLRRLLRAKLGTANPDEPLYDSLKAQLESAERALYAIDAK